MNYNEIKKRERQVGKRNGKGKILFTILLLIILLSLAVTIALHITGGKPSSDSNLEQSDPLIVSSTPEAVTQTPTPTPVIVRRGTAMPIPEDIRNYMTGLSYRANNNISLDDLSYLTIPHYDFNYNITEGHLVVNNALAEEVLDIFAELFDIKYPIERMELVDKYGADDFESIEYNNTSAFNYRLSTSGSGNLSRHALGRAIDINPQINPYVTSNGTGSHSNAAQYWSRDISKWTNEVAKAAYIGPNTEIYNIFVKRGWTWGGNWSSYRDYQHFEK